MQTEDEKDPPLCVCVSKLYCIHVEIVAYSLAPQADQTASQTTFLIELEQL